MRPLRLLSLLLPLLLPSLSSASAHRPRPARQSDIDSSVLNYALSLEHLSNAFYNSTLSQFSASDFSAAGYPSWVRGRLAQISAHTSTRLTIIRSLLPSSTAASEPCTYTFPLPTPSAAIALQASLSALLASAYLGLTALLTSPSAQLALASIAATEAREQGWVASAVLKGAGWSGAVETPLDVDQVWTLVSAYIADCPTSNPVLPVTVFPALSINEAAIAPGESITLQFAPASGTTPAGGYYAAFFYELSTIFVPVAHDGSVTVPENLYGTVYLLVTSSNASVTDGNTVAGPTILNFPFDSFVAIST